MAQGAQQTNVFMISENFFWPNRGDSANRPEVDKRILSGFEHRQKYVDSGKAHWYLSVGEVCTFTLLLRGTHTDFIEYMQLDPWFGLVKRDVKIVLDASGQAERFKAAIANVDYASRAANSPLISGDLSIASLAPDMTSRLLDTDCNC